MQNMFRSKIWFGSVFLIVFLIGCVAVFPLKAQACSCSTSICGAAAVTTGANITLSANLACDVIGTPAIDVECCGAPLIIDCKWHTISGSCTTSGGCLTGGGYDYVGISARTSNIEVKNCTIKNEQDAVSLSDTHAQIDPGVFILSNYIGVDLECIADAKLGAFFFFNHTDVNTLSLSCP